MLNAKSLRDRKLHPHTTWDFSSSIQCNPGRFSPCLRHKQLFLILSWKRKEKRGTFIIFHDNCIITILSQTIIWGVALFFSEPLKMDGKIKSDLISLSAKPAITILSHTFRIWVARGCFYIKLNWPPRTHFLCGRYEPCPTFCAVGVYFFKCKHHGSNIKQN